MTTKINPFDYPFNIPSEPYLFKDGVAQSLKGYKLPDKTYAVLAIGSNAAPDQLLRKFGNEETIPVLQVILSGYDIVYSGHFAGYGSIPATIFPSPGTDIYIYATLLNDEQFDIMNRSESCGSNYQLINLPDSVHLLGLDEGQISSHNPYCYRSLHGYLPGSKLTPIALKEIPAEGRIFPELTQREVQYLIYENVKKKWDQSDDPITKEISLTEYLKTWKNPFPSPRPTYEKWLDIVGSYNLEDLLENFFGGLPVIDTDAWTSHPVLDW